MRKPKLTSKICKYVLSIKLLPHHYKMGPIVTHTYVELTASSAVPCVG